MATANKALKRPSSEKEMLENVASTLATAKEVLTHLESSLKRAGFDEGATAYKSMCDVLLGQRLWSLSRADEKLRNQFKEVSEKAATIHKILAPYTETMLKLTAVNSIETRESKSVQVLGR